MGIMKKDATTIACCWVWAKVEINSPMPRDESRKSQIAGYKRNRLPTGFTPKTSHASTRTTVTTQVEVRK
jgi:hypothetical protein